MVESSPRKFPYGGSLYGKFWGCFSSPLSRLSQYKQSKGASFHLSLCKKGYIE
jgi:hypothetical protein